MVDSDVTMYCIAYKNWFKYFDVYLPKYKHEFKSLIV